MMGPGSRHWFVCIGVQLAWLVSGERVLAQETSRMLVQRIEAVGVNAQLARSVEDALVLELGHRKGAEVVSPAEMEQTVAFAKARTELGCDGLDECLVEIEKKLRVQRLITGKVSRLGSDYLMALGIIDLHTKTVGRRVTRNAADIATLLAAVPSTVDELLGIAQPKPVFRLVRGQRLKLAVMPLSARGVPAPTADAMTQILASELNQIEGISVISRDDIRAMLDKVSTEGQLGCTANMECIIEVGAALGLAKLVTGTVAKVKNTFVVAMQLIDIRKAEVENRVLESFDGDADELKNAVKLSAYQLAGADYTQRRGRVDFTFNVSNAALRLGSRTFELEHSQLTVSELNPGRYSLRVLADQDNYYPLQTDIYVAPNGDNVRTFRVAEKPVPWYGKWWVWTLSGVVAMGAVTAVVVLATQPPNYGTGEVLLSR